MFQQADFYLNKPVKIDELIKLANQKIDLDAIIVTKWYFSKATNFATLAKQTRKMKSRKICQEKLLPPFFGQLQICDEAYKTIALRHSEAAT